MVTNMIESGKLAEDEIEGESCLEESYEGSLEDGKDAGTGSNSALPYPDFVPISMRCLPQTHRLRLICLRMITNPYPSHANTKDLSVSLKSQGIF